MSGREQGSRDWRLMPAAVAAWAAALACMLVGWERTAAGMPWVAALGAAAIAIMLPPALTRSGPDGGTGRLGAVSRSIALHLTVAVAAMLVAGLSATTHLWAASRDPVQTTLAAMPGRTAAVVAAVVVDGPVVSSDRRGFDCRADVTVTALEHDRVLVPARGGARLYATGDRCALVQGGSYRVRGSLERPAFGRAPAWIGVDDDAVPETIRSPSMPRRAVRRIQSAFLRTADGLSDQGRVLVPGLTVGLLGSDVADPSMRAADASEPVDPTYAERLGDAFRTSGIMHLMAVSGGHFALIGALTRRLCGLLRVERPWMPAMVAGSYLLLAALMAPSDSVLRALAMGGLGAGAMLAGRRGQGMSMLCVTIIAVIIIRPAMAASLGFALSCAAVAGIILWAKPIAGALSRILPDALAEAIGVTVAAQIPALPLQTLMDSRLPVLGVLANLLTAPVVSLATLAGLLGLAVSWFAPRLGFCCAWAASIGTHVMQAVALWIADSPVAALPWGKGPAAATALLAVEAAMMLAARSLAGRRRRMRPEPDGDVKPPGGAAAYRPSLKERASQWLGETRRMLSTDEA